MKYLNKFFVIVMGLSLSTMILGFCLDQTLLKADFVTAQADKSGIYNDLAKQLPKQLAGGGETSPAIQSAFEKVVTPQYLQTNFDSYIHNLQSAYQHDGAVPPLDFTSLITEAEAQGIVLSADDKAKLTKQMTIQLGNTTTADQTTPTTASGAPTTASKAPGFSGLYRKTSAAKWLMVLGALVSAILVFLTAPHHRLRALGHGFINATFWLALYYAFFRIAPGIAIHQIKTAKDFSLSESVNKLITLAASGVAQRLLYSAIATAIIGAVLWVASMFMPHFGTGKDTNGDKRTPLPGVFHKS